MINRRDVVIGIGGSVLASGVADAQGVARASEMVFVVPSSPGGSADTSGRLLARGIAAIGPTPIAVTNRSAGQGVEGTMHVLNSAPDSGNILIGGPNGLFFSPARENLTYNSESFDPICMFSMASFVLVSRADRFRNIDELFAAMRQRPVNFAFSTADGRYLIERTSKAVGGRDVVAVSYRGGGEAVRDLHAGVVDVAMTSLASVAGGVQGGALQLLAHTLDSGNVAAYPTLPRLSDVLRNNDPALMTYHWHGIYVPKGAPRSITQHLQDTSKRVCEDQTFVNEHITRGMISRYMDSNALKDHHAKMSEYMVGYSRWLRETGA